MSRRRSDQPVVVPVEDCALLIGRAQRLALAQTLGGGLEGGDTPGGVVKMYMT